MNRSFSRQRAWGLGLPLVLLLIPVVSAGAGVETTLLPPAGSGWDLGYLLVESDGWQSFVVEADLDQGTPPYSVWLETANGTDSFFELGPMHTVLIRRQPWWVYEIETADRAPPPLAVDELDDLAGRVVQVRDGTATNVVLRGAVPLASKQPADLRGSLPVGRIDLQRTEPFADREAAGTVAIGKQDGIQLFSLAVRRLTGDPWDPYARDLYAAWLEQHAGSNDFIRIGVLANITHGNFWENGLRSVWELKLRMAGGAPLPLGVTDLADLAGHRLEVRNDSGVALLETVLPGLDADPTKTKWKARAVLSSPSPRARGKLTWQYERTAGRSTLEVQTTGLAVGTLCNLWIEDAPGSEVFAQVGPLAVRGNGTRGRYRRQTRRGDRLPFGVPQVTDLRGRAVQVCDPAGTVLLAGVVP